uniref:Kunitz-like inhibitor n=1 Tax=Echis coloratus TaxID=64175 RepID=A0A0A1WCH1_ECHCO
MSSGGLLLLLGLLTLWAELTPVSGQGRPRLCYFPADPKICKVHVPHFYYDLASNQCKQFKFGECPSNANNFKTRDECHYTCVEKPGVCPQGPQQQGQQDKIACRKNCENDWKCPGEKKCCRYGCVTECKDAVHVKFASTTSRPTQTGSSVPT